MTRKSLLPLLAAALLAACQGGDDAAAGAPPAGSPAATATAADAARGDDDLQDLSDYRLSMDRVERWYQSQRNVYQALARDPGLAERIGEMDATEMSLDQMAERYESVPEVRQAIEAAGLDAREFSLITMSLFQASFAQMALEMGASRDSLVASAGVPAENLDFVRDHKADMERMQQELAALAPAEAAEEEEEGAY